MNYSTRDLWPPIIQLIMGIERACSVLYPMFFRDKVERGTIYIIGITILFVVVSLIVGFTLAFVHRDDGFVMYYCGRKAAFSKGYGTFIYLTNVFSYVFGFAFNCIAYCKALTLRKSTFRNNQVLKIRYYLIVSLFSTMLVSIPNAISLCSAWIKEVDNAISKPSVWMACVNSALAPFVYFCFNREYRNRVINILRCTDPHKVETSMMSYRLSTTVRASSFS
uniref:G_PROTEIN_RECEP_F1_2 domain-containing protein n=1 Tax=Panagrellus redivivus TaxID=6233 RepID=A0A7E4V5S6_PANRE